MAFEAGKEAHYHIVPIGDFCEHEISPDCWCGPSEDADDPGIWVHHSLDRREEYEMGRMNH